MKTLMRILLTLPILFSVSIHSAGQLVTTAALPEGVKTEWDITKAFREATPTRERVCINGLWLWQPGKPSDSNPPNEGWGFFKVPGCWPGITDYMQKDFQTALRHPDWKDARLADISAAWYERTISIPTNWEGRSITLSMDFLNSYAAVFVDGKPAGEIRFPGGELDLSSFVSPGVRHTLAVQVIAMPLKGALLSYTDSNSARTIQGRVDRRGLCGDLFLTAKPKGPRIENVKLDTSVRRAAITVSSELKDLVENGRYRLRAAITRDGQPIREFQSPIFSLSEAREGRFSFSADWKPEALWDIHTATNQFQAAVSLQAEDGHLLDAQFQVPFGFREFWIQGRDFYLNGSRIFLCAVPLDNAQVGAATATYSAARESFERLKSIGINFVYTHNYGCEPGSHLGFEEILRAADDAGMLVSLSQPHFSHYEWKSDDADQTNGYARHAEFYARVAGNHPSVVAYSMSHNATGYEEDMNPEMIDGIHEPRDQWSRNNAKLALRAEAIVRALDPSRIIYHHASGNLGSMHVVNFYPNFAPIQELSDWFEHWATEGIKPVFTCEYGAPFTWDWTMYRGWYKGKREFGSAQVPWEFCLAEWNAQFIGDRAYDISAAERRNLRWEASQFREGKLWHRWDYPTPVGSPSLDEMFPISAMYFRDNWRAFRGWGVSGISPWEYEHLWKLRSGVDKSRKELPVDWENLQRPGFSPDFIDQRYERIDMAYALEDWVPSPAAEALLRNNKPLLAFIGGEVTHFTSKDHIYAPGETVEKQIVVINNSRQPVRCDVTWTTDGPTTPLAGNLQFALETGQQRRSPMRIPVPSDAPAGSFRLTAHVQFSNGEAQVDSLVIHVVPEAQPAEITGSTALFDPKNSSGEFLKRLGVQFHKVEADSDLSGIDLLIIGKSALTLDGTAPDISRVRDGLKVILFEQSAEVLEKRFGFRIAEYGLRQVFPRTPRHPVLNGVDQELLRDWRGASTLNPPQLNYALRPRYGPTVNWCGVPVPRLWRCGNRGNVASVLIEKPARGDFLPIMDGGYSLQYSPLLEFHEGRGIVLFCQLDVTGRTVSDPAAEMLTRNLLRYTTKWKPEPTRNANYVGDPAGLKHLEATGVKISEYDGRQLSTNDFLIFGPGGGRELATNRANWAGAMVLALGIAQEDAQILPAPIRIRSAEHISAYFDAGAIDAVWRGISPADLHNRDPRLLPLVSSNADRVGDGVMAAAKNGRITFFQMVPWLFDPLKAMNQKRTFRRSSFALTRLLSNLGVASQTPLLERFKTPVGPENGKRWQSGYYLDEPEEWDDPYRFFRW